MNPKARPQGVPVVRQSDMKRTSPPAPNSHLGTCLNFLDLVHVLKLPGQYYLDRPIKRAPAN